MSNTLPAPVGKLVDLGEMRLHLHMTGDDGPTVILEAGGGSWSLDWHLIQSKVATFTRVCSYDRAGFGWSDPGAKPRTSEQIARDLHALLEHPEVPKPYVLVGASFGGHTVRLYAKRFPEDVAGIVLLDARHEAIDARMPPAWLRQQTIGKVLFHILLLASRAGALSLLGKWLGDRVAPPIVKKLPPELRPLYLAVGFQSKYFRANLDELATVAESDQQLGAAGSLGSLPLMVIRHGLPDLFARMPAREAKRAEQVWQELQEELAGLSSNGRMLVAEHSGHAIQIDQPDLVVDVIRDMVMSFRKVLEP